MFKSFNKEIRGCGNSEEERAGRKVYVGLEVENLCSDIAHP